MLFVKIYLLFLVLMIPTINAINLFTPPDVEFSSTTHNCLLALQLAPQGHIDYNLKRNVNCIYTASFTITNLDNRKITIYQPIVKFLYVQGIIALPKETSFLTKCNTPFSFNLIPGEERLVTCRFNGMQIPWSNNPLIVDQRGIIVSDYFMLRQSFKARYTEDDNIPIDIGDIFDQEIFIRQ